MNNPILELYLGGGSWTTVPSADIVKRSIQINRILYNDLAPATSSASLEIRGGAPIIQQLLALNNLSIPMRIKDGSTTLFTGYLTDNYTWEVRIGGESNLRLSAEDVGIKKLKVATRNLENLNTRGSGFIQWLDIPVCDPSETLSLTANSFVHRLVYLAVGSHSNIDEALLGLSLPIAEIMAPVDIIINDDTTTWWDVAAKVLGEFGYTFYFDELGRFCLYNNWHADAAGATVVGGDKLISDGGVAVRVQKKLVKYTAAKVRWRETEWIPDERLFEDTTGGTNGQHSCHIVLWPEESYPPVVDETPQAVNDADPVNSAWVEYQCLDSGRELIRAANVDMRIEKAAVEGYTEGTLFTQTPEYGPTKARVAFQNTSQDYPIVIARLALFGDALVVKSHSTSVAGEDISRPYSYEAKYIRQKEQADHLASLYYEYYHKSNYIYRFSSPTDIDMGEVITLMDDTFTGLVVQALVTKKTVSDASYFTYEAHGISNFATYPSIIQQREFSSAPSTKPEGYHVVLTASPAPIFKRGSVTSITLSVTIYLNGVDVTDDCPTNRMRWYELVRDENYQLVKEWCGGDRYLTIRGDDLYKRATYIFELESGERWL